MQSRTREPELNYFDNKEFTVEENTTDESEDLSNLRKPAEVSHSVEFGVSPKDLSTKKSIKVTEYSDYDEDFIEKLHPPQTEKNFTNGINSKDYTKSVEDDGEFEEVIKCICFINQIHPS